MRDYGKISPLFWTGETGRILIDAGKECTIVSLYLMTSPHANMLGLYYLPIAYISHDTGLTIEGASKGLRSCIEAGFCGYDDKKQVVWVYEMARFQIEESLKPKDKRVIGINKEYHRLPKCSFLCGFFEKYQDHFHLQEKRENEAPSKPLRSQEQEQEQEQEEKDLCPELSVPDNAEPKPAPLMDFPLSKNGDKFQVFQSDVDQWQDTFPGVDVTQQLKECRQWSIDNPTKRKTASGIRRHISSWMAREQNRGWNKPSKPKSQKIGGYDWE